MQTHTAQIGALHPASQTTAYGGYHSPSLDQSGVAPRKL